MCVPLPIATWKQGVVSLDQRAYIDHALQAWEPLVGLGVCERPS
jgi:hypothetical protein